jgi:hypothetical protein
MMRRWLDIVVLLVALALIGVFFTISSPDETLARPISALPVLKRVLVVAACLLVIMAGLLAYRKHASALGALATLCSGVLWGALTLWQFRFTPLVSITLFMVSGSIYFFILSIKSFLALRSANSSTGQPPPGYSSGNGVS